MRYASPSHLSARSAAASRFHAHRATPQEFLLRGVQGHSIADVELNLKGKTPPDLLFHGTVAAFLENIRELGLQKRSRNRVHPSVDEATAVKVAQRRGKPIILVIAAGRMYEAGHEFFQSANGVWLTDKVPPGHIRFP